MSRRDPRMILAANFPCVGDGMNTNNRLSFSARRIVRDFVAFVFLAAAVGLGAGVTFAGVALLITTASASEPSPAPQTGASASVRPATTRFVQ